MALPHGERRDHIRREAIVRRIAAEFHEMPGLILSVGQASRLLGLDKAACARILDALERDGLLRRRSGGSYGRA
jgi:DNA-binding MarR family transcriptional regulator